MVTNGNGIQNILLRIQGAEQFLEILEVFLPCATSCDRNWVNMNSLKYLLSTELLIWYGFRFSIVMRLYLSSGVSSFSIGMEKSRAFLILCVKGDKTPVHFRIRGNSLRLLARCITFSRFSKGTSEHAKCVVSDSTYTTV